jgi:hypothetical protein
MRYMPKSKSDVHITPDRVWNIIWEKWGYTQDMFFDPCPVNPEFDGLSIPWKMLNYVNPPYTILKDFVSKAINESKESKETIMLLPAKTDQKWFHDLLELKCEIVWIRRRLKFKNNKYGATQPHFLVRIIP